MTATTTAWIRTASASLSYSSAAAAAMASMVAVSALHRVSFPEESIALCETDSTIKASPQEQQQQQQQQQGSRNGSKLLFLGTGSSTGCPRPLCTMLFGGSHHQKSIDDNTNTNSSSNHSHQWLQEQLKYCLVSNLAIQGNPKDNRDYRNNPSLLISYCSGDENNDDDDDEESDNNKNNCQNIVIDVGKTFREGALRWFPEYGISSLDAIVLTHHHMDAVGGLDDVRGFQRVGFPVTTTSTTSPSPISSSSYSSSSSALPVHLQPPQLPPPTRVSIPVFLSQECLDQVSSQFPWLFPRQQQAQSVPYASCSNCNTTSSSSSKVSALVLASSSDAQRPVVPRDVAALDIHVIDQNLKPFQVVNGLTMTPLPVWHGDDLISLGFAFSIPKQSNNDATAHSKQQQQQQQRHSGTTTNIVYISDISRMIPETLDYIQHHLPQPTHILVVDALLTGDRTHPVHYNLEQAVALIQYIKPHQAYLVGMSCDSFLPHEQMNQELREKYNGNIQLAHDGLVIEL